MKTLGGCGYGLAFSGLRFLEPSLRRATYCCNIGRLCKARTPNQNHDDSAAISIPTTPDGYIFSIVFVMWPYSRNYVDDPGPVQKTKKLLPLSIWVMLQNNSAINLRNLFDTTLRDTGTDFAVMSRAYQRFPWCGFIVCSRRKRSSPEPPTPKPIFWWNCLWW